MGATTSAEAVTVEEVKEVKEVKEYTYFNPKLMEAIATADLYNKDEIKAAQQQWEIRDK